MPHVPLAIRRLFPSSLRGIMRGWRMRLLKRSPIRLWQPESPRAPVGRALVSYITAPFSLYPEDHRNLQFSNTGIARSIVQTLNNLGYQVDLVEWDNTRFRPRRPYDLFFGHGGSNFAPLARQMPPQATKIYFATTLEWREQNRREARRFAELTARRGVSLPSDRRISDNEDEAYAIADSIICLGNEEARATFAAFPHVININNAAYEDAQPLLAAKDFAQGSNRFLFFSSTGNVHKGLDRLLEAFVQTECHLYICQNITPEFANVYHNELSAPRIHTIGYVLMRSPEFHDLMRTCNFIIHPSCAEGQPGSVLECMHRGLIPVLSRENNIDTGEFGITLPDCDVPTIARMVTELSRQTLDWYADKARQTQQAARQHHSAQGFSSELRSAVERIQAGKAELSF